jgi:uncharacterized coiled-coil protein SlyX
MPWVLRRYFSGCRLVKEGPMPPFGKCFQKLCLPAAMIALFGGCAVFPSGKGSGPSDSSSTFAAEKKGKESRADQPASQPAGDLARTIRYSPGAPMPELSPDNFQKLAFLEDQRKTLDLRVSQLEAALEEKNRALKYAAREIEDANAEIAKTRTEMDRWKKEMVKLRERLRGSEKDSLITMQSIITMLEQLIANGTKPPTAPESSQAKLPTR